MKARRKYRDPHDPHVTSTSMCPLFTAATVSCIASNSLYQCLNIRYLNTSPLSFTFIFQFLMLISTDEEDDAVLF